ncbi:MAG: hypothetical protein JXQ72_16845 [Anaerolineae bacterium]|nr:hypothetical protein [Anaerolineae bacterium]
MLIEHYDLDVFTPPCSPGSTRFSAIARLEADLSDVLPYLHAMLDGSKYNPAAPALSWEKDSYFIVFNRDEIAVGNLVDRAEAERITGELVALVNDTWDRRAAITPDHSAHRRPPPMQVYGLLPQTNCKQCGEPTCFNFALKLIAQQVTPGQCPVLLEPECADRRAQLIAILPS